MISKIIISIVVGVFVALACTLLGVGLVATDLDVAVSIGEFLKTFAGLLGLLAAIWYFFTNRVAG